MKKKQTPLLQIKKKMNRLIFFGNTYLIGTHGDPDILARDFNMTNIFNVISNQLKKNYFSFNFLLDLTYL